LAIHAFNSKGHSLIDNVVNPRWIWKIWVPDIYSTPFLPFAGATEQAHLETCFHQLLIDYRILGFFSAIQK
jgi:hypothetical protein